MKKIRPFLFVALAVFLVSGCISTNPVNFKQQVHEWVPIGTSVADAKWIMQKHNFECQLLNDQPGNPAGVSTLSCIRKTSLMSTIADWQAEFEIRDGKVVGYGFINL